MLHAVAELPATLGIAAPVASVEVEKGSVDVQQVLPLLQLGDEQKWHRKMRQKGRT